MDEQKHAGRRPAVAMGTIGLYIASPESPTRGSAAQSVLWSAEAVLVLVASSGLLMVAFSNYAAIRGVSWSEALFWVGLLMIFAPFTLRLVSPVPTRNQRMGMLLGLGLALYLVKVLHSPVDFNFPDEYVHLRNLNEILESSHLFNVNGMLPATPYYPGLEMVTAALVSLSGLSQFHAGLIVIGAARLIILLALFLLFEQLSGSSQLASLGAVFYTANPNYLFWSAQYSYESLSLPMAAVILLMLLWRERTNRQAVGAGMTILTLLVLLAVIATHHLTSYVLVGALWALVIVYRVRGQKSKQHLGQMALLATLATVAWAGIVATPTIFYLSPVFRDAIVGLVRFATDPSTGRQLFGSNTGYVAPLWERITALASVVAILLLIPFGLVQLKRGYWKQPFALLLGGAALAYPALLTLRLTRTSWEISNRTSEFLFIGLGFVMAVGLFQFGLESSERISKRVNALASRVAIVRSPAILASLASLMFVGGAIAGWPPNGRLAHPYQVQVGSQLLYPQGVTAANWMRTYFPKNNRVAVDYSNAHLLIAYGDQYTLTGSARGIRPLLNSRRIDKGELEILQLGRLQYVFLDRRLNRDDPSAGIFFTENLNQSNLRDKYYDADVYQKFDNEKSVNRLYDSGNIYIYGVEALSGFTPSE